jgi:hypothetical protein
MKENLILNLFNYLNEENYLIKLFNLPLIKKNNEN